MCLERGIDMTRQDVEEMFARRQQALAHRDPATLALLHSADGVLESPTAGGTVHGRHAIEEVYRAWFTAFPDASFAADESLLIDGDRVAQRLTLSGTDTGGFLGLPATGKAFHVPLVVLCTLADRQIVHERRIYDFTGMLIQIGVLKAKPA
jgi:steroid delta-isomerase-like uncharacterized protein